jgi:uncharacterized protein (TIGR03437 family)
MYLRLVALCVLAVSLLPAQTYTFLGSVDGATLSYPNAIIRATDGNFYGTTLAGGANGQGVVFKATPSGAVTTLYSFCALPNCADGQDVHAGLVQGSDGNFYGVTVAGGVNSQPEGVDSPGTVFKITPGGALTTLHSFALNGLEGYAPMATLIQATDGNFYGTTAFGGGNVATYLTSGTVFKISPSGSFSVIYNFCAQAKCADGAFPIAALLQGADGNFYGTTTEGGANGDGTIFKLTPGGALTVLHSFGGADGSIPEGPVVQSADGSLWGTTNAGGPNGGVRGDGTLFKLAPDGTLTTLYFFGITSKDGAAPRAGLLLANDGNYYGASNEALFQVTPAGRLNILLSGLLTPTVNGSVIAVAQATPATLVQGTDGNLYGTDGNYGIFRLTLGSGSGPGPTTPMISSTAGVVNGPSFQPGISPNSWITINGTNLSPVTDNWANAIVNGDLPTKLDGVSVSVGSQAAYIYYVSPTQVNALAPNIGTGSVSVTVTNANGTSSAVTAISQTVQPAFFQLGAYAVATRQDYSVAVKNGAVPGATTVPAKPGDVIILWGAGFGATNPALPLGTVVPLSPIYNTANPVTVTVGGTAATVYGAALAGGNAGLYQVAIQIPDNLANGDYPIVATVFGAQSPATTLITVQQ